jgi:hypothetical protein
VPAFEFASTQLLINLMNGLLIKSVPSREENFASLPTMRFLFEIKKADGYLGKQFFA